MKYQVIVKLLADYITFMCYSLAYSYYFNSFSYYNYSYIAVSTTIDPIRNPQLKDYIIDFDVINHGLDLSGLLMKVYMN